MTKQEMLQDMISYAIDQDYASCIQNEDDDLILQEIMSEIQS